MKEEPTDAEPLLSGMFTGELGEDELERVLERAERDPKLSSELDLVADLTAAAELEREALEAELRRPVPSPTLVESPLAAGGQPSAIGWKPLAALASAAGLALTLWVVKPEAIAADLGAAAPPPFFPAELRDGSDPLPALLAAAMEPYVAEDWAGAVAALDAFLVRHPEHGPAHFYRGVAHVELEQYELGRADFEEVERSASGYLAEHARWRAALLQLLRGDSDGARAELEDLGRDGGPFAPNALALLEQMKAR